MDYDVDSFIAEYPEPTSDMFQRDMFRKKEFYDLKLEREEDAPSLPTSPYKHQEIVRRFMSPDVLIKELLIVHEVGTGKTFTSQLITENFLRYGTKALVLVRGSMLVHNFKDELAMRIKKYVPQDANLLNIDTYMRRRDKLIYESYELDTFRVFFKPLYKRDQYVKKEYSNRVIIIDEVHNLRIQEGSKAKETRTLYKMAHWFLHTIENCRIVLLTGTPMWDRTNEIASLMNLILPLNEQLPTGKDFDRQFFDENGRLINEGELSNAFRGRVSYVRQMMTIAKRIRMGRSNPWEDDKYKEWKEISKENVKNNAPWLKYFKIVPSLMDDFQYSALQRAIEIRKENLSLLAKKKGKVTGILKGAVGAFHRLERNASLFVFPDGSFASAGAKSGYSKYVSDKGTRLITYKDREDRINVLTKELERAEVKDVPKIESKLKDLKLTLPTAIKGSRGEYSQEQKLENLRRYSAIYATVIKDILDHPNEVIFVYTGDIVKDSGAILFGLVLELFGFKKTLRPIDLSTPDDNRYTIITSEHFTSASKQPNKILKSMNDPANGNMYGAKIRVIVGSQKIGEGINIYYTRRVHCIVPHWNMAAIDQGIGRTIRIGSHNLLKPEERTISIFLHASVRNVNGVASSEATDNIQLYRMAEEKDYSDRQVYRLLKQAAIDCPLNYKRVVLTTDVEGERECDYRECNYDCDTMEHTEVGDNGLYEYDTKEVDTSTYNVLYATKEVLTIVSKIKHLFKKEFKYSIDEIYSKLRSHSHELILRALDKIISERVMLRDRYGMTNYLKEDNDVFFLGRDITSSMNYNEAIYSEGVYVTEQVPLEQILERTDLERDKDAMMKLCSIEQIESDMMTELNTKTQAIVLEVVSKLEFTERSNDRTKRIYDALKRYIHYLKNNVIVHTVYSEEVLRTSYNIISKVYKETGVLRRFDRDRELWVTCTRDEETKYNIELKEEETKSKLKAQEKITVPLYGTISKSDGKFRIVRTGSKNRSGAQCATKNGAIDVILELGIKDTSTRYRDLNREQLLKKAKTSGRLISGRIKEGIEEKDTEYIRNLLRLVEHKKDELCAMIFNWFKEHDLLLT